jgi:hypothetical protein
MGHTLGDGINKSQPNRRLFKLEQFNKASRQILIQDIFSLSSREK